MPPSPALPCCRSVGRCPALGLTLLVQCVSESVLGLFSIQVNAIHESLGTGRQQPRPRNIGMAPRTTCNHQLKLPLHRNALFGAAGIFPWLILAHQHAGWQQQTAGSRSWIAGLQHRSDGGRSRPLYPLIAPSPSCAQLVRVAVSGSQGAQLFRLAGCRSGSRKLGSSWTRRRTPLCCATTACAQTWCAWPPWPRLLGGVLL